MLLVTFFLASSCERDFDQTNINPNNPEKVTPDLLLPTIMRNSMNHYFNGNWKRGNIIADHSANQFTSAFDWPPADATAYYGWSVFYNELRNVNEIVEASTANGQNNYLGIALVLKSWMFGVLTDIYGDIPYSEATKGKADENYFPQYDRQEDIYKGILADLEKANTLIGSSNEFVRGDILYNGDLTKWKKFANSLRIRAIMRISDRVDPAAALASIVNDASNNPIFTNNSDQAALQYLNSFPNEFPLYYERSGSFIESRLSVTLEKQLKALNDSRIMVFAQPTAASLEEGSPAYFGVPNGITDSEEAAYNGGRNNQSINGLLWAGKESSPLASPIASQTLLMTYAELQFTLAEAVERGFITGNAASFYQDGIKASFEYWQSRIPEEFTIPKKSDIVAGEDYFAQDAVAYNGSREEKLNKIGIQKWIAYYSNGFEAWFDWRRTGIAPIKAGPANANNGKVPVRYLYPFSEQALNKKSYDQAIEQQGPDNINTRVWWDVQ